MADPRLLVHGQLGAVHALVVEQGGVPDAVGALHLLADVAAEPHRLAVDDRLHRRLLGDGDVDVQVEHGVAADHVAEVLHRQGGALGVLGARVVDQAHVVGQVQRHVAGEELLRRQGPDAVELLLVVGPLPVDAGGRGAQVDGQDAMDVGDDGLACDLQLGGVHPQLRQLAQPVCAAAQHGLQHAVHPARVGGGLRLRHGLLGHHAVLAEQVHRHVPLTAVAEHRLEQEGDQPVVSGGVGRLQHRLQEEVGPLELVPVHGVVLGELELLDPQLLLRSGTHEVQRSEQPATPGLLLVGHLPVVDPVRYRGADTGGDGVVERDLVHADARHRVLAPPQLRPGGELLGEASQVVGGQRGRACLHGRHGCSSTPAG